MTPQPTLSPRYLTAIERAGELHANDVRKGGTVPYLTHLLSVSALVLQHGGSEDQAMAARLHDDEDRVVAQCSSNCASSSVTSWQTSSKPVPTV